MATTTHERPAAWEEVGYFAARWSRQRVAARGFWPAGLPRVEQHLRQSSTMPSGRDQILPTATAFRSLEAAQRAAAVTGGVSAWRPRLIVASRPTWFDWPQEVVCSAGPLQTAWCADFSPRGPHARISAPPGPQVLLNLIMVAVS